MTYPAQEAQQDQDLSSQIGMPEYTLGLLLSLLEERFPALNAELAQYGRVYPGSKYTNFPVSLHARLMDALAEEDEEALYARLRELDVPEEGLANALKAVMGEIRSVPLLPGQTTPPGLTVLCEYFATGQGYHVFYGYYASLQDEDQAKARFRTELLPADQDAADFWLQGVQLIRGRLPFPMPQGCRARSTADAFVFEQNLG